MPEGGEAPVALHDVELVLRNQARRHDLRLDAMLPFEWGDRFGLERTGGEAGDGDGQ